MANRLTALLIITGAACFTASAQTATLPAQNPTASQTSTGMQSNSDDVATYATGKPLEMQSKEGFWGRVNPFARKKWVHRQIDPVKDQVNELDQLQSKNANDIRDVDSRSQAGIGRALNAANAADAHARDAAGRADAANTVAANAGSRAAALDGTVSSLDQYQPVRSTTLPFLAGRSALTSRQKAELDTLATSLAAEKGYILEVQGYSRAGVSPSQAMADSVVRYLVTAHQVPLYRIYRTGLGRQQAASGERTLANGVRVVLLHNSLATMSDSGSLAGVGTSAATN